MEKIYFSTYVMAVLLATGLVMTACSGDDPIATPQSTTSQNQTAGPNLTWTEVEINATNFPDENFRSWLKLQEYGADGVIKKTEVMTITSIDVSNNNIRSLKGIEYFPSLKSLDCYKNQIKDAAMDALVENLPVVNGGTLNVISNENEKNHLTPTQAATAKAKGWKPMRLDKDWNWNEFDGSIAINETTFPDYYFREWVLERNYGKDGELTKSEIDGITSLYINMSYIESIQGIEYFSELKELYCYGLQLTSLDVSKNTALEILDCSDNQLTGLGLSKNTKLTTLYCNNNNLTTLDVSKNTKLTKLHCYQNRINIGELVASLSTVRNGELYATANVYDRWNDLTNDNNVITDDNVAAAKVKGWTTYCYNPNSKWHEYISEVHVDETTFPDQDFRDWVLYRFELSYGCLTDDALSITSIDLDPWNNYLEPCIKNLKGIEYFTNLEYLRCSRNQLTTLDVSKNKKLTELVCYENQLTELNVKGCTELRELTCRDNNLQSLDLSGLSKLQKLTCGGNQLTSLNLRGCTSLTWINFYPNASIDALIECLPTVQYGTIFVDSFKIELTSEQIAAAKAKGWDVDYVWPGEA